MQSSTTRLIWKMSFFMFQLKKKAANTLLLPLTMLYEFCVVPFGISTGPSVFQLLKDGIIQIYLDDIVIPSSTPEEGPEKLKTVLNTLKDYGLEPKLAKCWFLQKKINFLGHIIEGGRIQPSEHQLHLKLSKVFSDSQDFFENLSHRMQWVQYFWLICWDLIQASRSVWNSKQLFKI